MRKTLSQFPDRPSMRYPERVNVAIDNVTHAKLRYLRAQGKDTAEFLRNLIINAVADVELPAEMKAAAKVAG